MKHRTGLLGWSATSVPHPPPVPFCLCAAVITLLNLRAPLLPQTRAPGRLSHTLALPSPPLARWCYKERAVLANVFGHWPTIRHSCQGPSAHVLQLCLCGTRAGLSPPWPALRRKRCVVDTHFIPAGDAGRLCSVALWSSVARQMVHPCHRPPPPRTSHAESKYVAK